MAASGFPTDFDARTRTRRTSPNRPQRVDAQSAEDGLLSEMARPARMCRRVTPAKEVADSFVNITAVLQA